MADPQAIAGCGIGACKLSTSHKAEAQVMNRKAGQTLATQQDSDGDKQSAVSAEATGQEERLDFLKQAIAFTEWNIRSFDTKAQISIAAFVLSINPLWSILVSSNARAGSSLLVGGLLVLFVTTVLLFGYVIWPVALTQSNLTGMWESKGLFYVGDPTQLSARLYSY